MAPLEQSQSHPHPHLQCQNADNWNADNADNHNADNQNVTNQNVDNQNAPLSAAALSSSSSSSRPPAYFANHRPSYGTSLSPQHSALRKPLLPFSPPLAPLSPSTSASSLQPHSYPPPRPIGPLSRVPSRPSFVSFVQIDFDSVATTLTRLEGAVLTGQELKHSIPVPDSPRTHNSLHVEELSHVHPHPHPDTAPYNDHALVLKIKPSDDGPGPSASFSSTNSSVDSVEFDAFGFPLQQEPDGASYHPDAGFAISIPVNPKPLVLDSDSSYTDFYHHQKQQYAIDEEAPLIDHTPAIDLAPQELSQMAPDRTAYLRRHGPRNVAQQQQVLLALPNADAVGPNTGLVLPNFDSKDNLTELMLVVPPHSHVQAEYNTHVPTTVETAIDAIEHISSIVPPLVDVESTVEVHGTASNVTVAMNVKRQVSWLGYLILAVALFSVASQGTAVKWLPSVDGMIAASWLMQSQTILMLPFALFQYWTLNDEQRVQLSRASTWQLIALASVSQVFWASGFFLSIDYTSLFHAWALNNIHALAIVLIAMGTAVFSNRATRVVSNGEILGASICIAGVALMEVPAAIKFDITAVIGDTIAALSSLGAIAFLNICNELRQRVPLFVMMAPISALNAIAFSVGSMMISGTDFSRTDSGALGWIQSDRIVLGLYLGGVVGFLGTVSCIAALKYLPNVVVGSVQTMMPVVGTIGAVFMGVDHLPDLWTSVGGALLLYGVLQIADATRRSEVTVVLNEHISDSSALVGGDVVNGTRDKLIRS